MRAWAAGSCLLAAALAVGGGSRAIARAAAPAAPAAPAAGKGDPVVLDSFDAPELDPAWSVEGGAIARVASGSGGALQVDAGEKGGTVRLVRPLPLRDLRPFVDIVVATDADREARGTCMLLSGNDKRGRFRLFPVPAGKAEIRLPLRFFERCVSGLRGDMSAMATLDLRLQIAAGAVRIDDLRLVPGDRPDAGERATPEEWAALAFPDGKGRVVNGRVLSLVTNLKDLQGPAAAKFLSRVDEGLKILSQSFKVDPPAKQRFVLVMVRDEAALRAFRDAESRAFGGEGFQGEGGTSIALDDGAAGQFREGQDPPADLYAFSASMAVVSARLGIDLGSNVFQVGIPGAILRRMKISNWKHNLPPGASPLTAPAFQAAMEGSKGRIPTLEDLAAGKPSPMAPACAVSFFEFLAARHAARLPACWDAVAALQVPPGEGALGAVAGALGMTADALERDWWKWGARSWTE
jgi:hypothetical protein